jgi:hypothetical protein
VSQRIPDADIGQVASQEGLNTMGHTRSGRVYYFGGGQINSAFRFEQVCLEIAKELEGAGYDVRVTDDALSVTGGGEAMMRNT